MAPFATRLARIAAAFALAATATITLGAAPAPAASASCTPSAAHPDPVLLLHGLGANADEDINVLRSWLDGQGYCTFAYTYGAYDQFPVVGGLRDIAYSAGQIAADVRAVHAATGAARIDLVGHSEGAFQSLYVTKTQGVAGLIGRVVAIAPPTHGTTFAGLYNLASLLGAGERAVVGQALSALGCPACDQLGTGGSAVATLDAGPIARPGVTYTVLTSRADELVTPTDTAFVDEPGVVNEYVQDFCPADPVGHIGEAYDTNVWHMVANALTDQPHAPFPCLAGSPG
ncbi:MAG TPA: alpha/beta fold hydrolase [Pseudonocardiaceae bacterium]|nr:alpha/beta fold hydrolase [Pseudonocardiaceae bacterium]